MASAATSDNTCFFLYSWLLSGNIDSKRIKSESVPLKTMIPIKGRQNIKK